MKKDDSLPTTATHIVDDSQIHVSIDLDALGANPSPDDPNVKDLSHIIRGGISFPVVEFKEGAEVIRQGDSDKTAYTVYSGKLEAYKTEGGKKIMLRTLAARFAEREASAGGSSDSAPQAKDEEDKTIPSWYR